MDGIANKICKGCGETKSLDQFPKVRENKDGMSGTCRGCKRQKDRERFAADPEKYRARKRDYRQRNKERITDYQKKWVAKNRQRYAMIQIKMFLGYLDVVNLNEVLRLVRATPTQRKAREIPIQSIKAALTEQLIEIASIWKEPSIGSVTPKSMYGSVQRFQLRRREKDHVITVDFDMETDATKLSYEGQRERILTYAVKYLDFKPELWRP